MAVSCQQCGKSFPYPKALEIHIRSHTHETPYKCNECSYKTSQLSHFRRHFHIRHKGKTMQEFSCMQCRFSTFDILSFENHRNNVDICTSRQRVLNDLLDWNAKLQTNPPIDSVLLPLTGSFGPGFYTAVPRKFANIILHEKHILKITSEGYVCNSTIGKGLHLWIRQQLGHLEAQQTDHTFHNRLDNATIRPATVAQNAFNRRKIKFKLFKKTTSKYKGVHLVPKKLEKPWKATITENYECRCLGYFATEIEAAQAYDKAAIERSSEFCVLNLK